MATPAKVVVWAAAGLCCVGLLVLIEQRAVLLGTPAKFAFLVGSLLLLAFGAGLKGIYDKVMQKSAELESQRDECRQELSEVRARLRVAEAILAQHGMKLDPTKPLPLDTGSNWGYDA